MSELEKLAMAKHPYYCSSTNYNAGGGGGMKFDTMEDFLDEFEDAEIDYNMVFRWDVKKQIDDEDNELDGYCAEVFIMLQRKGIFLPCMITNIREDDVPRFKTYLGKHFEQIKELWRPIE